MTHADMIGLLKPQFKDKIKTIETGVYRCERQYQEKPISVYYFVANDTHLNQNFNLKAYQDSLLAKDFYSHSGSLQWNYYLVFVISDAIFNDPITQSLRHNFEQDRIYTRKYVIPFSGLNDFLNTKGNVSDDDEDTTEDLLSRWMQKLDAAGLSELYDDAPRSKVINRYLEDTSLPAINHAQVLEIQESELLFPGRLKELNIEEFRPYPKHPNPFNFGRANLIFGPNGVGKTCLMEAIEAMYCGDIRRNNSDLSATNISAKFHNLQSEIRFNAKGTQKHKAWNQYWYGRPAGRKGPTLADNFGRYNFFDTDAAFRIAEQKEEEPLKAAFTALALGERVNTVETKLLGYRSDFYTKQKEYAAAVKDQRRILEEQQVLFHKMGDIPAKSANMLAILQSQMESVGLSKEQFKLMDSTHQLILKICSTLKECLTIAGHTNTPSLNSLHEKHIVFGKSVKNIKTADESIANKHSQVIKTQVNIKLCEDKISILNSASMYFKLAPGELESLAEDLKKCTSTTLHLKKAQDISTQFDLFTLTETHSAKTLGQFIIDTKKEISDFLPTLQQHIQDEQTLKAKVAELDQVLAEIRNLGSRYTTLSPNSSQCPLCGYKYGAGELPKQFERHAVQTHASADLQNLQQLRHEAEMQHTALKNRLEHLNRLDEAIAIAREVDSVANEPFDALLKELNSLGAKLQQAQTAQTELLRKQNNLSRAGITIKDKAVITARIKAHFPSVVLDNSGDAAFQIALKDSRTELDQHIQESEEIKKTIKRIQEEQASHLANLFQTVGTYEKLRDLLFTKHQELEHVLSSVTELTESLPIDPNSNLESIYHSLSQIESKFTEYLNTRKEEQERSIVIETTKGEIARATDALKLLEPKLKRCNSALEILDDILQHDNKETALKSFISSNVGNVTRIFRSIHSPKEFTDINIDNISLIRNTGAEAHLSSISTGQRAALALSIFLALNSLLKKGPPVVLIDDPVAHIDDLNALSFLDYLREEILGADKQIFFTTASTKLAELFRRKFDFLGPEFVEIPLNR